MSPESRAEKQPSNRSDPKGAILAQLHWLELLSPELQSSCWGPSADMCHPLVGTREFPGTFITCDYYVCFSVAYSRQLALQKKNSFVIGGKWIPAPSSLPVVILTLSPPVLFWFSPAFCSVSLPLGSGSVLISDGQRSAWTVSGQSLSHFFSLLSSPCVVFIFMCILCRFFAASFQTTASRRALMPSVPSDAGEGWKWGTCLSSRLSLSGFLML